MKHAPPPHSGRRCAPAHSRASDDRMRMKSSISLETSKRRVIGFDAVKHLLLARIEKRPARRPRFQSCSRHRLAAPATAAQPVRCGVPRSARRDIRQRTENRGRGPCRSPARGGIMAWFQVVRERRRAACDDPPSLGVPRRPGARDSGRGGVVAWQHLRPPVDGALRRTTLHRPCCRRPGKDGCGGPRKVESFRSFKGLENAGAPPEMIYRHQGNG